MKIRKNITCIVSLLSVVMLCNSCGDDFVDIPPRSIETAETFINNEESLELAVVGLYGALQSRSLYGQNYAYFTEHYSDNAVVRDQGRAGGRYHEFVEFNVNPDNLVLEPFWNAAYRAIQRANIILNRIGVIDMDNDLKQRRIAEAKFIRAMIYFDMVRIWGDVPLITQEIDSPVSQFGVGRDDAETVYAQIITDLIDADNGGLPNLDNSGRVSDTAVRALLGKVYLTRQEWSQASTILQSIVTDNEHQLLSNFSDFFSIPNENNNETIFEIQYADAPDEGSNFHRMFGPIGDGDNSATQDLIDAFGTDPRRALSYLQAGSFYYSFKYFDTAATNRSDRNLILLRYADVLLMLAESLNEQGFNTGSAFNHLNAIRTRVGLSALNTTDLPDQESFRQEVRLQRRLELAHENTRWFDLVRWGIAIETIENAKGITILPHQLLFPISLNTIEDNPAIQQNPNYF